MNTGTSRPTTDAGSAALPSQPHGSTGAGQTAGPHDTRPAEPEAAAAAGADALASDESDDGAKPGAGSATTDPVREDPKPPADGLVEPGGLLADDQVTADLPPEVAVELAAVVPGAEIVEDASDATTTRSSVSNVDRERTRELFGRLRDLAADDPTRPGVRDALVEQHLPLVEHLARRFRNRGELYDDLVQVATIGLIKSVDRFDLERGVEFSTYATPTIVGEIKRHFRDKGWAVRVPRRLQELRLSLTSATAELSQRNGRSPTVAELAGYLKISDEEVLEGLESANAYSTLSLDAGGEGGDDEGVAVVDTLGIEDEGLEGVEYRESLKPLLDQLAPREKKILMLRFFRNMTQSEIAREVGISQMHVSRLLARTLAQLREGLLTEE